MNYTEAADKYIEQILFMKDMVTIRQSADKITHLTFEQWVKIGGYNAMAKRNKILEDAQIGSFEAAAQTLERIFQDLDGKVEERQAAMPDMPAEDYQRLKSIAKGVLDKRVDEKFNLAFLKELDSKFQKVCIEEAESIIESFGPEPHDQATKSKIQHIRDLCQIRTLSALKRNWIVPCKHCGSNHVYSFTEDKVKTLVNDGVLKLDTKQSIVTSMLDLPYHADFGIHEHTIMLGEIVRKYLQTS